MFRRIRLLPCWFIIYGQRSRRNNWLHHSSCYIENKVPLSNELKRVYNRGPLSVVMSDLHLVKTEIDVAIPPESVLHKAYFDGI